MHNKQDTNLIEKLKNELLHKVESYLVDDDEFIPFGILYTLDGSYRLITISDEDEEYTIDKAVEKIKNHITYLVTTNNEYHSGGYCVDFLVNDSDAIDLNLITKHSDGWIRCYLPYFIQRDRSVQYGTIIFSE